MLMAGYGEQALPYLEEARLRSPNSARTLLAIGRIHLQASRLAPAREALESAAKLEELKTPAEAERLYRRAMAADPQSGDAANKLGLLLAKAGQTDDARALFEKALALRRDDRSEERRGG